ncbi:MAG: DUF2817 domain-containing protein [Fimbriimonadaceae bacterium]|nr:DUF2817 domain-containing protein [Fimbriimonadaceae bacterium]
MRTTWLSLLLLCSAARAQLPALGYNPSYAEVVRFCSALARQDPRVSVASLGQSAKGRQIPVVICHDPALSPLDQTRILILCRQHGNEPAGTVAMMDLLRDLGNGTWAHPEALRKLCLILVPLVNPDGAEANQRHNARDVDLNRDWADRTQPETQAIERLARMWQPNVVLDLHELHWNDEYGLNTVEVPANGVTDPQIEATARELQDLILGRLAAAGFPCRTSSWNFSNKLTLCHRHFTRSLQVVALLFESERQGLQTPLTRRAQMHRLGVEAVLEYYATGRAVARWPRLAFGPESLPSPSTAGDGANGSVAMGPAEPDPVEPSVVVSGPDLAQPLRGQPLLRIATPGVDGLLYLAVKVDGQGRYFANQGPFEFQLRCEQLAPGRHVLLVQAHRRNGGLVEKEWIITVEAS